MLRTRLWMGALLVALAAGVLVLDQWLGPWYPFLFLVLFALALAATHELLQLLAAEQRPPLWLCAAGVVAVLAANWPAHVGPTNPWWSSDAWQIVGMVFAGAVLAAFLAEMATFREPGGSVVRIALTVWVVAYLGLLPSFLAQLRWRPGTLEEGDWRGAAALALTIFVPKFCDIGAYFTGRLLGRHHMSPVLSPKKTWEGLAGGFVLSALTAVGINRLVPVLPGGNLGAVGFALSVGAAGVLGDLAESLIKRDCRRKDASQVVPGFGGVLDVIDSILFAAPVAYCWLGR
jgi:phosphatidate cytidylyltransferase